MESHSRLWVQKLKVTVELFRQIEGEELEKIKLETLMHRQPKTLKVVIVHDRDQEGRER